MEPFLPFVLMFSLFIVVLLLLRQVRKQSLRPTEELLTLSHSLDNPKFDQQDEVCLIGQHEGHEVRIVPRPGRMKIPSVLYLQLPVQARFTFVLFRTDVLTASFKRTKKLHPVETSIFDSRYEIRTDDVEEAKRFLAGDTVREDVEMLTNAGYVWLEIKKRAMTAKKLRYTSSDLYPGTILPFLDRLIALARRLSSS